MVVLSPITPETEKSHHQFLCFYRNFELDDEKLTVIVYRSGLTKGTGVLSGARRIDVTMSITRIPL